jgi:putative YhdH/YhfP family quinone oxidoreductase
MTRFHAYRLFEDQGKVHGRVVEMSVDELSAGEVTLRVAYSSINYKDALAATGQGKIIRAYPRVSGIDLAGTVVSSRDARYREGDEVVVHGFGIGVDTDGGHAQYARVSGDWVLPLPAGLDLLDAATIGVAGYTAALSIHLMELNDLRPESGNVVVSGATGGVGSIAIDMLARRGYQATAITGKDAEHDYLRQLGATEVLSRNSLEMGTRPLEKALWAGAIDSVGGEFLAWLTRSMQPYGTIACFGNAGGAELHTSIIPFILRGVRLLGINANSPMPLRRSVWQRIATDLRPRHLDRIAHLIALEELPAACAQQLKAETRGRTVIRLQP